MSAAASRNNGMQSQDARKPRKLSCARCGTPFACALDGDCWCAAEIYKLPMPTAAAEDCVCPACLRKAATAQVRA